MPSISDLLKKDNHGRPILPTTRTQVNNVEKAFTSAIKTLSVDTVRSIEVTAQSETYSDEIVDLIPYVYNAPWDGEIPWLTLFKAYHRILTGMSSTKSLQYLMALFLFETPNPFISVEAEPMATGVVSRTSYDMSIPCPRTDIESAATGDFEDDVDDDKIAYEAKGKRPAGETNVGDKAFEAWYSNKDNLNDAKVFFELLTIVLSRAIVKQNDTVYFHVQHRMMVGYKEFTYYAKPPITFKSSEEAMKKLSTEITSNLDFCRSIVKFLATIATIQVREYSNAKSSAFVAYAIELPIAFTGFHVTKLMMKVAKEYHIKQSQAPAIFHALHLPDVDAELENFNEQMLKIDFFQKNGVVEYGDRVVTTLLWPYARIFDGRCFLELSVHYNYALTIASIFLLPMNEYGALKMFALKNQSEMINLIKPKALALRKELKDKKSGASKELLLPTIVEAPAASEEAMEEDDDLPEW